MGLSEDFQANFDRFCPPKDGLHVLEAGGGSTSHLALPKSAYITTIDISSEQLERNAYAQEKILGDLETFHFEGKKFDVIVCWDVIEHLKNPRLAFDNLLSALSDQGILVFGAPIVNSAKGLITKFTPHSFHILIHRYFLHSKNAGKLGYAPFPTYMRLFIAPNRLRRYAEKRKKEVVCYDRVESIHVTYLYEKSRILWAAYKSFSYVMSFASCGSIHPTATDFMMIIKNPS